MQEQFVYSTDDVLRMLRPMTKTDGLGPNFGEDFLWALLARKEGSA